MARQNLNNSSQETANYSDKELVGLDENDYGVQEYHHNVSSIEDKGSIEIQEWSSGSFEKCNLIVNYLPHEIDDLTLKVRATIEHS